MKEITAKKLVEWFDTHDIETQLGFSGLDKQGKGIYYVIVESESITYNITADTRIEALQRIVENVQGF